MIKIVCFMILGLALAQDLLSVEEEWQKFKGTSNKLYSSQNEESYRFKIFQKNYNDIKEHNEKYARGETSYKKGINKFADWTSEEFQAVYGHGVLPRKDEKPKN